MPETTMDILAEQPIKKTVAKNLPILDQITLRQLKVEYKNEQFVRISEENYHQEFTDVVERGAKGLPTLFYYFKNSNDIDTQRKLFHMICALKPKNLRLELETILKTGNNKIRHIIINNLGQLGYVETIPLLKKILENRKPDNREFIPIAQALMELGDKESARMAFEKYLMTGSINFRTLAIEAILEIGSKKSMPVLKMLVRNKDPKEEDYFLVKKALLALGDESILGELIAMGKVTEIHRHQIIETLFEYIPIKIMFHSYGYVHNFGMIDDDIFFNIVDEWYHETILKITSPYRPPTKVIFSEPFAKEKFSAWNLLKEECANNTDNHSIFRLYPNDSLISELDSQREIIMVDGNGHGGNLNIYVCLPDLNDVKVYIFSYQLDRNSAFHGTYKDTASSRASVIDTKSYAELVAVLRVILDSKLITWWGGRMGGIWTSNDFTISFAGLGKNASEYFAFCGYKSSASKIDYLKLTAAQKLFLDLFKNKKFDNISKENFDFKIPFSKGFLNLESFWAAQKTCWWVRDRMFKLARNFGDETLIDSIKKFLNEKFVRGDFSDGRKECEAVNTLAEITKKDFRFDASGSLKKLELVVQEYLEFLKNK